MAERLVLSAVRPALAEGIAAESWGSVPGTCGRRMTLAEQAISVRSRKDLAEFILALAADLKTNREQWEHSDLSSFLAAMAAWVEDMNGYYENRGQDSSLQPIWGVITDMLMAARTYE